MTEEEFRDLIVERLLEKIERWPLEEMAVTVKPILDELLADIERDGIIESLDATMRVKAREFLRRLTIDEDELDGLSS